MATQKDRIVQGDTYSVHYTCWKKGSLRDYRDASAFTDPRSPDTTVARTPLDPLMAEVYLVSVITQAFVPLGISTDEDMATVVGNDVSYLIPAEKFADPGDYKVYTRVSFTNGPTLTMVRSVNVESMT